MKKVISIGCSYALDLLQLDGIRGNRFSLDAASIETIYEMVRHLKGMSEFDNFDWVINITQIGRLNKRIPNGLEWESPSLIKPRKLFFDQKQKWCFFSEGLEEKRSVNFPTEWWDNEHTTHFSKPIEEHIRNYLVTIYEIQKILDGNNFVMFLMNNTFDGWFYKKNGSLSHVYTGYKGTDLPSFKNTFTLESICPDEWANIDFTKFCFYDTKESKFGGLDEFGIINYDERHFATYRPDANLNLIGQHPNHRVQIDFFNKFVRERL